MKIFVHLSDIHFRANWDENIGVVLSAFWLDLKTQIEKYKKEDVYIVLSGDIVQSGGDEKLYDKFFSLFDKKLSEIGIDMKHRICVPGNHDLSTKYIDENKEEHNSIAQKSFDEKGFNDYMEKSPKLLLDKFSNYFAFKKKFALLGIDESSPIAVSNNISDEISVFSLNSALCACGGYGGIKDEKNLRIDTRIINRWVHEDNHKYKIIVMHHSPACLAEWAEKEFNKIVNNNFVLALFGHTHEQDVFYKKVVGKDIIECCAPPLFTDKNEDLGYALIEINDTGISAIKYRQWTKKNKFVPGVNYSENETGIIEISPSYIDNVNTNDDTQRLMDQRLQEALCTYINQPIVWLDRYLSEVNDFRSNGDNTYNIDAVIDKPEHTIIKAPAQFGLTCLAYKYTLKAWSNKNKFWLYLDCKNLRIQDIEKYINKELLLFNKEKQSVACVILDSWGIFTKNSTKIFNKIRYLFPETPIIIMQTLSEIQFISSSDSNEEEGIDIEIKTLYLLALKRSDVRQAVEIYNQKKYIAEDDIVVSRVISDLEVLNIHRTPLNCFTLLTIAEKTFDESPVNRTLVLEKILYLLFDIGSIPTYKSKPDVRDCEFVLGKFCENLIRTDSFYFSKDEFLLKMQDICKNKLIDVDITILFDILYENNIITCYWSDEYYFRFSYWLYYFAAKAMLLDENFAKYILEEKKYVNYPEIIEFYTGIDRNRNDALKVLIQDIKSTCKEVCEKVGLPGDIDPYAGMQWNPKPEGLQQIQQEISASIQKSSLPDEIKDKYADLSYDHKKPYCQTIQNIMSEYSLLILMQDIRAASRALRNSDYADTKLKKELFEQLTKAWQQLTNVLFALAPVLAARGYAGFAGAGFLLSDDFNGDTVQRLLQVIQCLPSNIVLWYKDDLYSNKIAPLLIEQLKEITNPIVKHQLALYIILEKPKSWKKTIQEYIHSISKNSFYLCDVLGILRHQYEYSYATTEQLNDMKFLIKSCIAKHEFGTKNPGADSIKKVPDKLLPKRNCDADFN